MNWLDETPYLVLDTETTGLTPGLDEVVEIGALLVVGSKVHEFCTIVEASDAALRRSEKAFSLNGFTVQRVLKYGIPASNALKMLRGLAKEGKIRFLAGHNIMFDVKMLGLERALRVPLVCTQALSHIATGKALSLLKAFERSYPGRAHDSRFHTALGDAKATHQVLKALVSELKINSLEEAIQRSDASRARVRAYFDGKKQ